MQASKEAYPTLNYEARPRHLGSIRGRLDQFVGGHFDSVNLSSVLFAHKLDDEEHVKLEVWSAPARTKPTFEEAKRQRYKPAHKGESFGPSWSNHWFKVTVRIPKGWQEYERVQLEFDCSGEAMVYTTDGEPLHGLTGGFGSERRVEFIIPPHARKAGVAHYYIEASCNELFGQNGMDPPDQGRYYRLNSADLVVPNMEAWRLLWDFDVLHQIVNDLPDDTPLHKRCQYVANDIMNTFKRGDLESVGRCRKLAEEILGEDWEKGIQKESERAHKQAGTLWAVGHCHIDTAWLWPFSVTQQKSARSWSTQIDLMDRYPEHRFSATQAQQFKWLEKLYPSLFMRIKDKVAEGTFQPLGATWVEMDCNMPSGEALVRQFLYGQRYYKSRFGFKSRTFVLPDTFGYASQLPQIARLAGCENFFTQKLSWNNTNNFPNSTFNWVGLDRSQILTHMTPVNNYNSGCHMSDIRNGQRGNKNMEVTTQALLLFGNGDGGGGPTPPMLEKLRRTRAVGKRHDAGGQIPLVKMGGSFEEFYDAVRRETDNGRKLPNWVGELYAEFHRGTYTSHGSIKRGNRKGENLLREAEHVATMASLVGKFDYPKEALDEAWEDLLLCQFHDVLPGSGIGMIYEDAEERYANVQRLGNQVLEDALKVLYPGSKRDLTNAAQLHVVDLVGPRREVLAIPARISSPSMSQLSLDGSQRYFVHGPAYAGHVGVTMVDGVTTMQSDSVRMQITDGRISSIYDVKEGREIIPQGQTGGLVIMEDCPNYWDAWDVDQFHLETQTHLDFGSVRIVESGPIRGVVEAHVRVGQSSIAINIILDAVPASLKADARSLIRFDAVVDWHEKHRFLKFELPMDIINDNATYDTQFGVVQRPTHRNTSWDNAKFEVCGHKFADLSEFGYGVAILNDCKYGYSTEGNVMRLSLLRAPTQPDANCDMGQHRFSWAIYPHKGTFAESDVPHVATLFNNPVHVIAGDMATAKIPTFSVDAKNVTLETIKRGEDDEREVTVILRLFEQFGGHAKATLQFAHIDVSKAEVTNILEEHIHALDIKDDSVKLEFRGFEVKTVRLTVRGNGKKRASGDWIVV